MASRPPSQGESEPVLNPRDGRGDGTGGNSTAARCRPRGGGCTRAFAGWSQSTPAQRSAALLAMADVLEEHGDELARLEALNAGKPLAAVKEMRSP